MEDVQERLIVALDVGSLDEALPLVEELSPYVGYFKIGLELLTRVGAPRAVSAIHTNGGRVFYDGKFNDIPNTIAKASKAVADLNVAFFDVHASSGYDAMKAAVMNRGRANVLAVTVLTALTDEMSTDIFGAKASQKVLHFAEEALRAGVQGVVCSGQELFLFEAFPKSFMKVTPGVRPIWAAAQDQKRVLTPQAALEQGATHLVIGRPILNPPRNIGSPVEAAKRVLEEMDRAAK